ncbi:YDG domain-containing protein, partial [Sphaerotilus montanus]|uniref:YDG domain-containing protein n=1 Tax=Sphaerotilus montanus TaxID=522889 RepID=UPI003FA1FB89
YALSYQSGTLTVDPATLTVITGALTGTTTKVYDGTTVATLSPGNFLLNGWIGADGATVNQTRGTYDNANAGTAKTVTVRLGAEDFSVSGRTNLANYQLPAAVSGNIGAITPAPLTIMASANSKTYDGTTSATATPVVTGLVGQDTVSGLSQVYASRSAGVGKTVSVAGYAVQDGNGGRNYAVTLADNTRSVITRVSASVASTALTTVYNGAPQTQPAATTTGFLPGDDIAISGLARGRNAGTYTSSFEVGGADAGNYNVSVVNANLTITPATLTMAVAPLTQSTGSLLPDFTVNLSGFVGADRPADAITGTLNFTSPATLSSPAGSYGVTAGGLTALHGNYVFAQAPGNSRALTLTAAQPSAELYLPKATAVPNFPDNAGAALGSVPQSPDAGNLNYVFVRTADPATTPAESGARRAARPGVDGTAVPSANGPLDIFVVDGGINGGRAVPPPTTTPVN